MGDQMGVRLRKAMTFYVTGATAWGVSRAIWHRTAGLNDTLRVVVGVV